jgi:probable phosphoglycerate mutase
MNRDSVLDDPDLDDWRAVRVVLVRHGESQGNAAARFEGQAGPGLIPRGDGSRRARLVAYNTPAPREAA